MIDKHTKKMLLFAIRYPGWHSFQPHERTRRIAERLRKDGFVEINEFNQFRLISPKNFNHSEFK